ncbi:hypothetical protein CDAR_57261 [Caerostris darwini]|uniref:Uncharacterized protein n=1 Tax=Caerostris darwini TaxID=1538125 RepID=A0AAV4TNK3_9ARAC|nr:hypothetical protein CDAR_57261 [Caerostris darwini]
MTCKYGQLPLKDRSEGAVLFSALANELFMVYCKMFSIKNWTRDWTLDTDLDTRLWANGELELDQFRTGTRPI